MFVKSSSEYLYEYVNLYEYVKKSNNKFCNIYKSGIIKTP